MPGKKMLEPLTIKSMTIKNRIAFAPILGVPNDDRLGVNDETIQYFEDRAKGGAGFIMTGTWNPNPALFPEMQMMGNMINGMSCCSFHDDSYIDRAADMVKAVHSHGCKIGMQIGVGTIQIGPSPSPFNKDGFMDIMGMDYSMEQISEDQILEFENDVALAAGRAKAAGFDCVELHCAHSITLHCAFISPFYNKRKDKYGGSWERRLRFPIETLEKMRETVGNDYPIVVRLSADEYLGEEGIRLQDTIDFIIPKLEATGLVDCFDISQTSMLHNPDGISVPLYIEPGRFVYLAAALKSVTDIPLISAPGMMNDMEMADKFIEEGKADIVYMGKQLLADADTPRKYFEGRPEDIRKCIGDLRGMGDCVFGCSVNYRSCFENQHPIINTNSPKNVLIIGGGVGGMEAARISAMRGHKVTIVEKEAELGGIVSTLANMRLMVQFQNLVDYLTSQLKKLGVDIMVCKEATTDYIEKFKPDVLIVATGTNESLPEQAQGQLKVMTHLDALKRIREIGQKVVIWGLGAVETAISFALDGKDVTLVGRGSEKSLGQPFVTPGRLFWIMKRVTDHNLAEPHRMTNPRIIMNADVKEINAEGVVLEIEKLKKKIPADTVIVALGRKKETSLFDAMDGKVAEIFKIGDCSKISDIYNAISGANEVAMKI